MKDFISLLIITFSLLIISNVDSKGQLQPYVIIPPSYIPCNDWNTPIPNEPNCKNIGCDNPQAQWQSGMRLVSVPQWPGCYFAVWYCYRVCNLNPYIVQTSIYYWHRATSPCPDCNNYETWFATDPQTNVQIMGVRLWEAVTLDLYQEHVDYLDNQGKKHLLYCPNNKVEYTATKSACKSYCYYQVNNNGNPYGVTEVKECNQGSCCVYGRKYCIDPMTHEVVIEGTTFHEEILQEVGFCDEQQQVQFSTECNNGFNRTIEPCNNNCIEPD